MPADTDQASEPADVPLILTFLRELAEYEKLAHEVVATDADMHAALFGERPVIETVIASLDGQPVGYALFFPTFSTFLGKPGTVSRRSLRAAGCARIRRRPQAARASCPPHGRARLGAAGVVGARLERAVDRVLQEDGREADGRMDRFQARRGKAYLVG